MDNSSNVMAALVSVAIEQSLRDVSDAAYENIGNLLYKKYKSYFYNCLEHPEYLVDILKTEFGAGSIPIVKNIYNRLEEFSYQKSIEKFLLVIDK